MSYDSVGRTKTFNDGKGVYTYSYTARATTIGEFQLPPVHAEAMYQPELFGHSASSKVRIVE